jgi:hypothetical protein
MLQLSPKLEECSSLLLVPFLQGGVIWLITRHSGWITIHRSSNRVQTAFDTADIVLGIMYWAVAVVIADKGMDTVKNSTTGMSNGNSIDDKNTTFFFWQISLLVVKQEIKKAYG